MISNDSFYQVPPPRSNTYVIEKRAFLEEDLTLDGNVIVGQEVKILEESYSNWQA